jgi:ketosteroid isomerase-like protein
MYLLSFLVQKMMTPKEFLSSYVEKFNARNVSYLIYMYETHACLVVQPRQIVNGAENIRQNLQGFIDMNGNLISKVKAVIQTNNLALVNTEWSFNGTGPDGKPVNIAGKVTDGLRQQSVGTWCILIDNPWGTDL